MRSIFRPVLLLVVTCFLSSSLLADRGPSTPEERDRLVQVTKALEVEPDSPQLRGDREWAVKFLIEVPDIHVTVCGKSTDFFLKSKKYKYGPDLMALATLEGGRYYVEHPDNNNDKNAQALAMLEGALKGYEAVLKKDPKAHLKDADELLAKRDSGQLATYLGDGCSKK